VRGMGEEFTTSLFPNLTRLQTQHLYIIFDSSQFSVPQTHQILNLRLKSISRFSRVCFELRHFFQRHVHSGSPAPSLAFPINLQQAVLVSSRGMYNPRCLCCHPSYLLVVATFARRVRSFSLTFMCKTCLGLNGPDIRMEGMKQLKIAHFKDESLADRTSPVYSSRTTASLGVCRDGHAPLR